MTSPSTTIRAVDATRDAPALTAIYNHYIRETIITFEEEEISVAEMQARIATLVADKYPYLVLEKPDGSVAGYAYLSQFRARSAYRFAAETSVYLAPGEGGAGRGTALYAALVEAARRGPRVFRTLVGVVTVPNAASDRMHAKLGFKKVGLLRESGFKFGQWIDVCLYDFVL